jgi:hypothetical protein
MKTYKVTNVFRCEITHIVNADNIIEAKEIAYDKECNFTKDQILSEGLEFCNTIIKEV